MYTPEVQKKVEDRLLATHISNSADFEAACMSGDGQLIMSIVDAAMEKNNLYTKGSHKLREDILKMLEGQSRVSKSIGQNILFFVWNSRLAGIGFTASGQ